MAIVTVTGEPGSRHEEVARLAAQRLGFEFITGSRLDGLIGQEFGDATLPDKAWEHMVAFLAARLAAEHHLVVSAAGAEFLFRSFPSVLRARVVAPEFRRTGALMLDRRLDRPAAKQLLLDLDRAEREQRHRRFGRTATPSHLFDVGVNAGSFDAEQMADIIVAAVNARRLAEEGLLTPAAEVQAQFQARLQLSRHGISPPGKLNLKQPAFYHPSEQIFANLLDFYRIAWEYEPRSFPIQWDKDGKVLEAFTPDFYLPEFDLYVELTTMKQSLVTKKNRKIKLLKAIYPQVNIQVFYQKDIQNLIFKYGLSDRPVEV